MVKMKAKNSLDKKLARFAKYAADNDISVRKIKFLF
jgi:hypothetical protein